jgi:flagellar basal-body rod protein FlgF
MDKLIFNAANLVAQQAVNRQMLTNELANLSTTGFKTSFAATLQSVKVEGAGFDTRFQSRIVERDFIDLKAGSMMVTGKPLDVAMQEATVMGVQAPNGELAFTRRGDLRVNASGVLETGAGEIVRGEDGPITMPLGSEFTILNDGSIYARNSAQPGPQPGEQIGKLMLRDASAIQLRRRQDGLYAVDGKPPGTDIPVTEKVPSVVSQTLEGSNVSAIESMTKMIDHARTFESQIRIIKEAKDLDGSGATMIRQS